MHLNAGATERRLFVSWSWIPYDACQKKKKDHPANSESHFKVNYQGEVGMLVDPNTAIAQLIDPDPTKPVFLTGLRLPAVDNLGSRAPHDICKFAEPVDESNV